MPLQNYPRENREDRDMKTKRILTLFFCLILLVAIIFPVIVQARGNLWEDIGLGGMQQPFDSGVGLMGVIATVISIAFALAGIVAVVFLIIGGFNYVTAGGNPEQIEMAKSRIMNSIIGLVIILVSYLIVQFIMIQVGATNVNLPRSGDWGG